MTDVNFPGYHYHGPWEPFWQKVSESGALFWIAGGAFLLALVAAALILFAVAYARRSQASPWPPASASTATPEADRGYAAVLHLMVLPVIPLGILIFLILWLIKREKDTFVDAVGRNILNYLISYFLFALLCAPLIFLFGLGLLGFFAIWVCGLVCPIIGAVRASNGIVFEYPLAIRILQPPRPPTPVRDA